MISTKELFLFSNTIDFLALHKNRSSFLLDETKNQCMKTLSLLWNQLINWKF